MEDINELLQEYNDNKMQKELDQPYTYIKELPGKNIRQKLTAAFNYWMNIPPETLDAISDIIQMLHNASLMIDDIEDNSCMRRGVPVAHSVYGLANTLNTANYVFFLALEKCQQLNHPDAVKIYTKQMLELHRGQGMEIYWRDNFICPTESAYKLMTIRKTGGLFKLGIDLMKLFCDDDDDKDFTKLIAMLGLFFQIRDDYCNLTSKEYSANKSYCDDLTEGKFSFPILHAVHNDKNKDEILTLLKLRTENVDIKKRCVQLLENAGSFEYTRNILEKLYEEATNEVTNIGPNKLLYGLLDQLHIM